MIGSLEDHKLPRHAHDHRSSKFGLLLPSASMIAACVQTSTVKSPCPSGKPDLLISPATSPFADPRYSVLLYIFFTPICSSAKHFSIQSVGNNRLHGAKCWLYASCRALKLGKWRPFFLGQLTSHRHHPVLCGMAHWYARIGTQRQTTRPDAHHIPGA